MNRKLKTTITISAVIAGSILMVNAQGAKADDVNKTSSPQEAGLITKTKEGTVKKADVDKAKEEYETSKSKEGALEKTVQEKTEKAKTLEEKVKKLENTKKKTESITEDTMKQFAKEIDKTTKEKEEKAKALEQNRRDLVNEEAAVGQAKIELEKAKNQIKLKKERTGELKSQIQDISTNDKQLEDKKVEKAEEKNTEN